MMIEGDWIDRLIRWGGGIIVALFTILGSLVALIWSDYREKHRKSETRFDNLSGQITDLRITKVGEDTLTEMKSEWREDLQKMREDFKERDADHSRQIQSRHDDNKHHMEKIEGMVVAVHQRLDRLLEHGRTKDREG